MSGAAVATRVSLADAALVHRSTGWYVTGMFAVVGLWALVLAARGREPGMSFRIGFATATVAVLVQVGLGLWARTVDGVEPGDQHTFYGIVIVFTLAFAYINRAQLARRPALSYGVLALFLMGLALRAISTLGHDF